MKIDNLLIVLMSFCKYLHFLFKFEIFEFFKHFINNINKFLNFCKKCTFLQKYTNAINGFTSINLTKLDVLSTLKSIKICTGYRNKNGSSFEKLYPSGLEELSSVEPIYEVLPGWESDISKITEFKKLPTNCIKYVERVENLLGVPISWIGTGPERESMILRV